MVELHYQTPKGAYAVDYIRDAAVCQRKLKSFCSRHIEAELLKKNTAGVYEIVGRVELHPDKDNVYISWFDADAFIVEQVG